jgi:wee1-like protein kinase
MHSKGVSHLDVKPENIILVNSPDNDSEDATPTFKLVDLGLASLIRDKKFSSNGEGDKRYLPAEALEETVEFLDKVDMFSLGATLYELALGRALPSTDFQWQQIRNGELEMDTILHVPDALKHLIRGLLHPNPANRRSAKDIADFVEHALRPVPVEVAELQAEVEHFKQLWMKSQYQTM